MVGTGRGRGRIAAFAVAGAVVVLGAGGCGANGTGSRTPAPPATAQSTVQPAAGQPAAGQPAARTPRAPGLPAAQTANRPAVPWNSVGAGWVLDTYSTGTVATPAPVTLYLVSPAGAKYALLTWPASATPAPTLEAWAGNKTEALFQLHAPGGLPGGYGELNLSTGTMTRVAFPSTATTPLGYTLPDGQQILGSTQSGATDTIARYTQGGALVQTLATGADATSASYSPDGTALAVPAPGGLLLVSNGGGVLRKLPVPGTGSRTSCQPVRWWNAGTVLASCSGLWLVPASGAAPSRLTPVRDPGKAPGDLGDIDAWPLPSGLYLQSLGPCGTLELNRQASDGALSTVTVPGMINSPVVVTASGSELLVEQHGCHGGGALAWFNPATGAERWLFKAGAGPSAIAYADPENGTIH
jgi:hypothetical protein